MRRARSSILGLAVSLLGGGCYSYAVPVADRPAPASSVELTLNDRGREAMENHLGPEILLVSGTVVTASDSDMTVAVRRTETFSHTVVNWQGENVTIQSRYVRQIRERRFSTGRTAVLVGSATASLVFLASRPFLTRLFGDGGGVTNPPGGGPTPGN